MDWNTACGRTGKRQTQFGGCRGKVEMSYFGQALTLTGSSPFLPWALSRTGITVRCWLRRATTVRP